jgi:hypothetical protein
MRRYRIKTLTAEHPPGTRVVHNFYPGPLTDPGRDRRYGLSGFRYWITDEPMGQRCYCGWLAGREHYATVAGINAKGEAWPEWAEQLTGPTGPTWPEAFDE